MSTRCSATTKAGRPCRAWAVRGTDPPRCAAHGGGKAPVGAPLGNQNALTHGFYSSRPPELPPGAPDLTRIERIIADLAAKQVALSTYIDRHKHDVPTPDLVEMLRLHGQNASRLGRLLRDKRALSGDAADGISAAIAQALDELGTELGADL